MRHRTQTDTCGIQELDASPTCFEVERRGEDGRGRGGRGEGREEDASVEEATTSTYLQVLYAHMVHGERAGKAVILAN